LRLASIGQKSNQENMQFKVVSFSEEFKLSDEIFVREKNYWRRGNLGYRVTAPLNLTHLDTAPSALYALDGNYTDGALAMNNQGRVVGFVVEGNYLLPNTYITRLLPTILGDQEIVYRSLGVEGWHCLEQPVVIENERQNNCFAVSRIINKASLLKKGDVVLEINGKEIDPNIDLWYTKDEVLRLLVLRNGKTQEIEAKALEVE
jgi:hypothetical protein